MQVMSNIGALVIRQGLGGPVYYNYNKEPPKRSIGTYLGPYNRHISPPKEVQTGVMIRANL